MAQVPSNAAPSVARRDFAQPLRLGAASLAEIQARLVHELAQLESAARTSLGAPWKVELERAGEVNGPARLGALAEPCVVGFFQVQGQPGSVLWPIAAAAATVDATLGAPAVADQKRRLSRVEAKLIADFLQALVQATVKVLGQTLADFELLQDDAAIRKRTEELSGTDPHRLELALRLRGPAEPAPVLLHLGGFRPPQAPASSAAVRLPGHLGPVEVELRARLGASEIPLNQVLGLEEGDVIPLEADLGELAWISIEGKDFARARLGTHQGRLALRIEEVLPQD